MTPSGTRRLGNWGRASSAIPLILAFALVLILPELVAGLSRSDSYRYNIAWMAQFRDLARAGDFYPRWLPWSWGGLGSPTFYFYPPLYFWLAAAIDALSLRALGLEQLISLTSAIVLACSGLAMFSWLRVHAGSRTALIGALAYMAAPYHLYDLYLRGALAESCAYAIMPLVALSIRQIASGRIGAHLLFAFAYAGLMLAHLPSAVLASLFLIVPYAIFCGLSYAKRPFRFFAGLAASGLAGIGMAACYLLPAISLVPYISIEKFNASYFRPLPWFFWNAGAWPAPLVMSLVIPLTLAILLMAAGVAWPRKGNGANPERSLWAGVVLACAVMISGLVPQLWQFVVLERVQFPWRLLLIGEFAAISCLAVSLPLRRSLSVVIGTGLLTFCLVLIALVTATNIRVVAAGMAVSEADIRKDHRDAPEYLPPGYPVPRRPDGVPEPTLLTLPSGPEAVAAATSQARLRVIPRDNGGLDVLVDSPAEVIVTARRFYFPSWRVTDQDGNSVHTASDDSHLLSWRAPAGRSRFAVRAGTAPGERTGMLISLGTLLFLLAAGAVLAGWRRRPGDTVENRG